MFCRTVLQGHKNSVARLAFSPDGELRRLEPTTIPFASGSTGQGKCLASLEQHRGPVTAGHHSQWPNACHAGKDKMAWLWSFPTANRCAGSKAIPGSSPAWTSIPTAACWPRAGPTASSSSGACCMENRWALWINMTAKVLLFEFSPEGDILATGSTDGPSGSESPVGQIVEKNSEWSCRRDQWGGPLPRFQSRGRSSCQRRHRSDGKVVVHPRRRPMPAHRKTIWSRQLINHLSR